MTITAKYLRDWEKSARMLFAAEQKRIILERFGTEPEPHVWTDQDIYVQIQNFLGYGEFSKSIQANGPTSTLPDGIEF